MNTHIHLLEALTELHKAWPDPRVTRRLDEVFKVVRDRVYGDPGYLRMFFRPDWQQASEEGTEETAGKRQKEYEGKVKFHNILEFPNLGV